MDKTIQLLYYEWKERHLPEVILRDVHLDQYLSLAPPKIIVITGFRRVGKTYLLFSLIEQLFSRLNREEVIYFNFEDERIEPKTEFLTSLFPALQQETNAETKFLFLDEIQNIPLWDKWVRRIYDTTTMRLFITGSNSKLSSRELPTALRGRALEIQIYPLSFKEFLRFKKIPAPTKALSHATREQATIIKALNEYVAYGGLPEVVLAPAERKKDIIQSYYHTVVQRDIIERFSVQNEEGLRSLLRLLLNATIYTISKMHATLKSMHIAIGKATLQQYISYIENTYFLYSVPYFSYSFKDQLQYPRKIYFVDNAFLTALSTQFSRNHGRLYENTVFSELVRRYGRENIFYWKEYTGREVDFVVKNGEKVFALINVCYDLTNAETKEREIISLKKAMKEFKLRQGIIIYGERDESKETKDMNIQFIPLWKWLLNLP